MHLNNLTEEEKKVIIDKGTEMPLLVNMLTILPMVCTCAGNVMHHFIIRPINSESTCGWPSFDNEIAGAVKELLMQMEFVLKSLVLTVVATLVMFIYGKCQPTKYSAIV